MQSVVDRGIRDGLSYDEIAKEIRVRGGLNKNRSQTIAITETHSAFNRSIFGSVESSDVRMESKECSTGIQYSKFIPNSRIGFQL